METFLIKTVQLLLCFCILIVLHEGGHFFFAKLFKVRVEKFCLFFGKSLKLFTWRGTDYCIGWIPLGGYVKISGMIDESMDTEQMKQPAKPWEFRSKPAWQRLLIMLGGVMVNFVLALFIYAMILFVWGDTYIPIRNISNGFKFNTEAKHLGFADGDILVGTDTKAFDRYNPGDIYRDISEAKHIRVLRQGHEVIISLPGNLNMLEMLKSEPPFVMPLAPSLIDSVAVGSPAARAGVRPGDHLLAFNGRALTTWNEFDLAMNDVQTSLNAYKKEGNARMVDSLSHVCIVVRHADLVAKPDTIRLCLDDKGLMGIIKHNIFDDYKTVTREYNLLTCFPAGIAHGWNVFTGYVNDLKYVFTADGAKSIGSFGTIGSLFPSTWNWLRFWELTAFISLMLAFINIVPIPALDGGHVLFLLFEVVTRRRPSDKFLERAQWVGMSLLFILMAYAIFNDIMRFVF